MAAQTEAKQDEQQAPQQTDSEQNQPEKKPVDPPKRRRNIAIGVVIAMVLVLGAVAWWIHSSTYETTDDAQVDAHLNPVAARVQGTVSAVYVEDNQTVQAGQPLVDLDTKDMEISLAQAQANYDQAVAQMHAEDPNTPITELPTRAIFPLSGLRW